MQTVGRIGITMVSNLTAGLILLDGSLADWVGGQMICARLVNCMRWLVCKLVHLIAMVARLTNLVHHHLASGLVVV